MDDFSSKNPRDPILALPAFSLQAGSALGRGALAGALRATPYAQDLIAAATEAAIDAVALRLGVTDVETLRARCVSDLGLAARGRIEAAMAEIVAGAVAIADADLRRDNLQ